MMSHARVDYILIRGGGVAAVRIGQRLGLGNSRASLARIYIAWRRLPPARVSFPVWRRRGFCSLNFFACVPNVSRDIFRAQRAMVSSPSDVRDSRSKRRLPLHQPGDFGTRQQHAGAALRPTCDPALYQGAPPLPPYGTRGCAFFYNIFWAQNGGFTWARLNAHVWRLHTHV